VSIDQLKCAPLRWQIAPFAEVSEFIRKLPFKFIVIRCQCSDPHFEQTEAEGSSDVALFISKPIFHISELADVGAGVGFS